MKKLLILAGIAIVAVSSCAKDFVKEVNKGHAIDFKVVQTKGQALNYTSDLSSFYVTAIDKTGDNYFTNVGYGRSGDYYTSAPESYYWPIDGSELKFYAYYPSLEGMAISGTSQKLVDYVPAASISDHVDFMTATATGDKEDVDGVSLTFNHRLASIALRAKEYNAQYDYSISAVKIVNLKGKGTFNFSPEEGEKNWSLTNDLATYTMSFEPRQINGYTYLTGESDSSSARDDAMVLPQDVTPWNPTVASHNGAYIAISLKVTSTESGDQIYPAAAGEHGWVAVPLPVSNTEKGVFELTEGNRYVFTLDLTDGVGYVEPGPNVPTGSTVLGQDIKFTVKVNPSEEPDAESITRKALEGEWHAKKVEVKFTYEDDYEGSTYDGYTYEDPENVKNWFNNNGFYKFSVDNDYNLYTETPDGVTAKSAFFVSEDGKYIYLESVYSNGEYYFVPEVYEIDNVNNTCIIYACNEDWYTGVDRHQYLYYDRK